MKKSLFLVAVVLLLGVFSVNAEAAGPSIFSFDLSAFGGYTGDVVSGHSFGVSFAFDDNFFGGFHHYDIDGAKVKTIDVGIRPIDKLTLDVMVGVEGGNQVFGVGLGFEFFQKKQNMFASMAAFVQWMAATGGAIDLNNGGVVMVGLKTRFGI